MGPPELKVVLALTRSAGSVSSGSQPGLGIRSKVSGLQGLQCLANYQPRNLGTGIFIS